MSGSLLVGKKKEAWYDVRYLVISCNHKEIPKSAVPRAEEAYEVKKKKMRRICTGINTASSVTKQCSKHMNHGMSRSLRPETVFEA